MLLFSERLVLRFRNTVLNPLQNAAKTADVGLYGSKVSLKSTDILADRGNFTLYAIETSSIIVVLFQRTGPPAFRQGRS